jgi:hypothetical protein
VVFERVAEQVVEDAAQVLGLEAYGEVSRYSHFELAVPAVIR